MPRYTTLTFNEVHIAALVAILDEYADDLGVTLHPKPDDNVPDWSTWIKDSIEFLTPKE